MLTSTNSLQLLKNQAECKAAKYTDIPTRIIQEFKNIFCLSQHFALEHIGRNIPNLRKKLY